MEDGLKEVYVTIRTTIITYPMHSGPCPLMDYTLILQYLKDFDLTNRWTLAPTSLLISYPADAVDDNDRLINDELDAYRRYVFQPVQKCTDIDLFAWLPNETIDILYSIKKTGSM